MEYSITFTERDYDNLVKHLFSSKNESAAYILCRPSITDSEIRLLVREIIPVIGTDVENATPCNMKISSISFIRAMKKADDTRQCFIFAHSHLTDFKNHSKQDDKEETKLFRSAYIRISSPGVHGSIVFSTPNEHSARICERNGTFRKVSTIRVIGNKFRFYSKSKRNKQNPIFFDRQIRAFGHEIQIVLSKLKIGIIGLGGTGSAVAEQLIRLGVGTLYVSDGQLFDNTNVNRVYGSRVKDKRVPKVKITERLAKDIGLGTSIKLIQKPITFLSAIKEFRKCDVIFGCTDDEWGRSILTRLAIYYIIPIFDMGVRIHSENNIIKSIEGRVTTLLPFAACLFCRERIKSANIEAETLKETNPKESRKRRKEGYIPELGQVDPSIIPFTTTIASASISEFLHRLTGYLGEDRLSTEIIYQFHESIIRKNNNASKYSCFCNDNKYLGRADVAPFLDLTWRQE